MDNAASSTDLPPLPNLAELADTARIKITKEEISDWEPKINAIVGWFGQLNDIDIEKEWERLGKLQLSQEELEREMRLRLKSTIDEGIEFDERSFVQEHANALSSGPSARRTDGFELPCTAAFQDGVSAVAKFAQPCTVDTLHDEGLLNAVLDVLAGHNRGGFSPHMSR